MIFRHHSLLLSLRIFKKNELLVQTPWTHILGPEESDEEEEDDDNENEEEDEGWYCDTVRTLAKEMKLGNESFYAPYVTYLNNEPDNQLPTIFFCNTPSSGTIGGAICCVSCIGGGGGGVKSSNAILIATMFASIN